MDLYREEDWNWMPTQEKLDELIFGMEFSQLEIEVLLSDLRKLISDGDDTIL